MGQINRLKLSWSGEGISKSASLFEGRAYFAGRDHKKCEVICSDPHISGQQLEIKFKAGFFYATNIGRGQPVIAQGHRMGSGQRARLSKGAVLELGRDSTKISLKVDSIASINASFVVICPKCNRPVDLEWRNCPWCGQNLAGAGTLF